MVDEGFADLVDLAKDAHFTWGNAVREFEKEHSPSAFDLAVGAGQLYVGLVAMLADVHVHWLPCIPQEMVFRFVATHRIEISQPRTPKEYEELVVGHIRMLEGSC